MNDIDDRFSYHEVDSATQGALDEYRTTLRSVARYIEQLLPDGREKSLALTNLEQVMFWGGAAIARAK